MTTLRNELVVPFEVDYSNPLTEGLVALIVSDGTKVYDIISGTVANGVVGTDYKIYPDGGFNGAVFETKSLGIKLGDSPSFYTLGSWNVSTTGESGSNLYFTSDGVDADYWRFKADGAYSTTKPRVSGDTGSSAFSEVTLPDSTTTSLGWNISQTGGSLDVAAYGSNILTGTQTSAATSSNSDERTHVRFGEDRGNGSEIYFVAVFNSHRTVTQFEDINLNPYQLLADNTQHNQEFNLNLSGKTGRQFVMDDRVVLNSFYSIEIVFRADPNNLKPYMGLMVDNLTGTNNYIRITSAGNIRWRASANASVNMSSILDGNYHTIKIANGIDGSSLKARMWVDGNIVYTSGTTSSFQTMAVKVFGTYNSANYPWSGNIKSIRIISRDDPTFNRFYSFNQTTGTVVTDLYNNATASLQGFPDYGYKRFPNGNVSGYLFGGSTTALLKLSGAYSGTITFSDDTTASVSGSGDLTIDNTYSKVINKIEITDTVNTYLWDCTSGYSEKLIETLHNNHAAISDGDDEPWELVQRRDVSTIGTGRDYDTVKSWVTSRKSLDTHQEGWVYGETPDTENVYTYNGAFTEGVSLIGKTSDASLPQRFYTYDSKMFIADMGLTRVYNTNQLSLYGTTVSTEVNTTNSLLLNNSIIAALNIQKDAEVGDTYIKGRVVHRTEGSSHFTNCVLSYTGGSHLWEGTYPVETSIDNSFIANKVTTSALSRWENSQDNVDMSSWFDSEGKVTPTGQTTLKGTGWWETDVLGWNYATGGGNTPVEQQITYNWDKHSNVDQSVTITWIKSKDISPRELKLDWNKNQYLDAKTLTVSWIKTENILPVDIGLGWEVHKTVSTSSTFSWDKYKYIVGTPLTISWDKQNVLQKELDLGWFRSDGTTTPVFRGLPMYWDKYSNVEKDLTTTWYETGELDNSLTLSWEINENISPRDLDINWNKNEGVAKELPISWETLSTISKDINLEWFRSDPRGNKPIEKEMTLPWDKYSNVFQTLTTGWQLGQTLSTDLQMSWFISEDVSKALTLRWDVEKAVLTPVTGSLKVSWDKYNHLTKDITVGWEVIPYTDSLTPNERVLLVPFEPRTKTMFEDDRNLEIPFETRTYYIKGD